MTLSADEKQAIRDSLGKFTANCNDSMVVFYQALLGDNPQYHPLFVPVKDVKVCDFAKNAYIHDQQGPKTGKAVADLVSKLDDCAALKAAIQKLVAMPQHTAIKLKKEDYGNAFKALVSAMSKVLGGNLKQSDIAAWNKLTEAVLGLIDEELKKH